MYVLRKCIELENRRQEVQFSSLSCKKEANSLVSKYFDYQTKLTKYYRLVAENKLSRKQKKKSKSQTSKATDRQQPRRKSMNKKRGKLRLHFVYQLSL